jgi:hypothetical protein
MHVKLHVDSLLMLIVIFSFFYGCQQKVDRQENKQAEAKEIVTKGRIAAKDSIQVIEEIITVIEKNARQKKATEYGGGDVYGVKTYYFNQDSTLSKVIDERSSGEYGFSKEKFYFKNESLIFTERLTAEIDFGKEGDTSKYYITYEKNFFPTPSQGTRFVQQKIATEQADTLFDKAAFKKIPLTEQHYAEEKDLLKQLETYQLLDEK